MEDNKNYIDLNSIGKQVYINKYKEQVKPSLKDIPGLTLDCLDKIEWYIKDVYDFENRTKFKRNSIEILKELLMMLWLNNVNINDYILTKAVNSKD